ncbi:MAG: phosphatase PAP2 family protein [Pseudolysinimonas sp.]|uniref:phosphatase PAP2 family protein n=1 Tax=Pseudolysinimonas sp. TaxID=2680009 RepID=UPI003266AC48
MTGAPEVPRRVARFWPFISAALALVLTGALAAVIFYRENDKPFGFELEWMGEIVEHRAPFWTVPALVFNAIGGGLIGILVVPLAVLALLLLWRRPWSALFFFLAVILSAAVVQGVKVLVGRPRPLDILVTPDFGSFPSGHSANAAVIATVIGIILTRRWVWIVGATYTAAMMLSRTYLGAHWISDTIGGVLIGAGVAIIVWAPLAARVDAERRRAALPVWVRRPPPAAT